jgi:general stress protein YciG
MPRGNYSYSGEATSETWGQLSGLTSSSGTGESQPKAAISEPGSPQGRSDRPLLAKEPDRPGTSRRGTSSGRGQMEEDFDQEESRGRGSQSRRATERGQTRRGPAARTKKARRGFAAMSPEQQREIARKGGLTVSRNRRHMAEIGRVGGEHSHGGRRARARR